jgi:hypothetical protein
MTLYFPPSLRGFSPRRMLFSTWVDHLPFGYDIVDALRPRVIVELGVQAGLSYFCFCQAVQELGVGARCFAVDTWEGDSHTDPYGEEIFTEVTRHNEEHYAAFSTLMRMRFEDALPRFEDGSIDLLHIDGFHSYEAVKTDFETWYPKVVPGGIVLFHDVAARIRDFGAWRFWKEAQETQPETFSFNHGFGLGVLRKPGGERPLVPLLEMLFSRDPGIQEQLRKFYVHACAHHEFERKYAKLEVMREAVRRKQQEQRVAPAPAAGGPSDD